VDTKLEMKRSMPAEQPQLLTKLQVAQLAGIGVRSVERLTARGVLRVVRPAGMRCARYRRSEVVAWIEAGCPVPERARRKGAGART